MVSVAICPHCQDFTKQKKIADFPGNNSKSFEIESSISISLCLECNQVVDHETIQLQTPDFKQLELGAVA